MNLIKNQAKRLEYILIFYSFLLPWGHVLQNIGIGLLGVFWIVSIKKKKGFRKNSIFPVILFGFYFFIQCFSLFYTANFSKGFEIIIRQLPLLVIPIFLFTSNERINKSLIYKCLFAFSISLSSVVILNFLSLIFKNNFDFDVILNLPGKEYALGFVNYHYLYLGYYISTSIILLLYYIVQEGQKESNPRKILILINIIFLTLFLVLLGSRISLFVSVLGIIVLLLVHFYRIKKKVYGLILIALIAGGMFTVFSLNLPIVEKTKEMVNYKGQYSKVSQKKWGGKLMREEIWSCVGSLISESPIFGYGLGSVQVQLDSCLQETSEYPMHYLGRYRFNAHNQFFQFALNAGSIGLISFLLFVAFSFKNAYKKRNFLYVIFLGLSLMTFMTESILVRNHGIVFFAFLCSLLYLNNDKEII